MSLRISGLASGMDTESIIKDLMKAHRIPVDKMKQQRQLVQWQQEAFRDINAKLRDFRNNTLFTFNRQSTLSAKSATVFGNTSAVTAKALAGAQSGSLSIEVLERATAASNVSTGDIRASTAFDPSKPLSDEMANLNPAYSLANNTFAINGTPITIEPGDSLNSVIEKINKTTNVTAFYDSVKGQVSLVSKQTGETNGADGTSPSILLEGAFLTDVLKLDGPGTPGTNAEVVINGIMTERTSNTFAVNGVQVTLNAKSMGSVSTIEVDTDADAIVNSIKGFVEKYNEINRVLTEALDSKRYREYQPLTEEQKKEMSEKEIELWEEKAKSGLLRGDSILESAYNQLRSATSAVVNNGFAVNSLAKIGIKTGSYAEKGQLHIDETKLRQAIEDHPDAVLNLFTSKGNGDADISDVGVAKRMYDKLETALKEISTKAGTSVYSEVSGFNTNSTLSKLITDYNKQIDRMNDRLLDVESRFYRQFSAMESAIQRMNTQSAYLLSQFGGGA